MLYARNFTNTMARRGAAPRGVIPTNNLASLLYMFNLFYYKPKNRLFLENLEKNGIDNPQCYVPIYQLFFDLNETNYNSISFNHKNHIVDFEKIHDTISGVSKKASVYIKYSPVLDPIQYMMGKYDIKDPRIRNLPQLHSTKETCLPKILDTNNSSYIDGFFTFLTSILLNNHSMFHGVDYYGSLLGIQKNFSINVIEELEHLDGSDFFHKNLNSLFTVDNPYENQYFCNNSRNCKSRLIISDESSFELDAEDIEVLEEDTTNTKFCGAARGGGVVTNEQLIIDDFTSPPPRAAPQNFEIDNVSKSKFCGVEDVVKSKFCEVEDVVKSKFCEVEDVVKSKFCEVEDVVKSKFCGVEDVAKCYGAAENGEDTNDTIHIEYEKSSVCSMDNENDDSSSLNYTTENEDNLSDDEIETTISSGNRSDDDETVYTSIDDEDDNDTDASEVLANIYNFPVNMICMEKCTGTLDSIMSNLTEEEWRSALFQVIMILLIYQKTFYLTHNDLHTNNIMYVETKQKFIHYEFKGITYKVPTFGRIYKIIDYGRAIYTFSGRLFCSDSFNFKGDASTQYNFPPYYNENKPIIEPNYSFDLCRLGCSIYDFIFDDENNTPQTGFEQIILDWCTDDNGKNIMYKKNGEERYLDFKLYKMIARTVHNHTPYNQLQRAFFKQYKVSNLDMSSATGLYLNIDEIPCYVNPTSKFGGGGDDGRSSEA